MQPQSDGSGARARCASDGSDRASRARAPRPSAPSVHPPLRRPPRHRGRSADRRGTRHSSWLGPVRGRASSPNQGDPLVTIVAHELKASYAFIERNFFLTRRYWGWEVAFLVYSVAGALSISLIGADQGSPDAAAHADGRRDLLELPVGRVQLDRRDHLGRALGRHPRVHLHGAGPALVAAARLGAVRDGLRPGPHGRDLRRARAVLPAARPVEREPGDRRSCSCSSARSASSASA